MGDIQGCRDPLDRLLDRIGFAPDDLLYCVGDLVNRGPDSTGVLRRLREMAARVVLGNHDLFLLRIAAGCIDVPRGHLLRRVIDAPDAPELLGWLATQPVLRVEDDLVMVHGGLHPQWQDLIVIADEINPKVVQHIAGDTDPRIEFATVVRHCDTAGRRPPQDDPPPGPPYFPWDDFYHGSRTVVFGHWARRGLVYRPRIRGLDSGCVYGGSLTAWIVEEDRMVSEPAERQR